MEPLPVLTREDVRRFIESNKELQQAIVEKIISENIHLMRNEDIKNQDVVLEDFKPEERENISTNAREILENGLQLKFGFPTESNLTGGKSRKSKTRKHKTRKSKSRKYKSRKH